MIRYLGGNWNSSTGSVTLPLPAGTSPGDTLLLACETANENVNPPAGWTAVPGSPQGTSATRLSVFWKTVGASEPNVVIPDPGNHLFAAVFALSGVAGLRWSGGATATTSSTAVTFPAADGGAVQDGDLVFYLCANGTDNSNNQLASFNLPSGEFVRPPNGGNTSSGNGGGLIWGIALAHHEGLAAATATLTTASTQGLLTVAFAPEPDPNTYVSGMQAATVATQHEDAAMVHNGQAITVLSQLTDDLLLTSMQLITVVVEGREESPNRRRGFMSFTP